MSDIRRNPNGTWAKGQCGNPGGIPGGGGPQPGAGADSRMAYVRKLNTAAERANMTVSDLEEIARDDKNPNKRAAASHILAQAIRKGDDASMIRERARLAADLDDRTEGKPVARQVIDQRLLVERISRAPGDDRTDAEIAAEIASFILPAKDDAAPALPTALPVPIGGQAHRDMATARQDVQATRDPTFHDDPR